MPTIGNAPGGADSSSDGTEKIPVSGSKYMLVSTIAEYIRTLTQTLTGKTINLTSNTLTGTTAEFNTALSDGNFATQAGTETLTNKTVNLSSNTLTGTTAQFNTALSDGDFATLAGSETLTNKTITAPVIATITNTGTITLPTSTDTLVGRATTDTLTNKTLTSPTLTTPTVSGAITFPDNVTQTFNPGADNAGINVGSIAGDPATPDNGDIWYDSTANELTARIGGSNVALGAGGGGSVATDTIWDAKGDLAGGTGANTAARLAVGTNGQVLVADSAEATGMKWSTVAGTGDVVGPGSATDNAVARFDSTTGKLIQNSGATIDDNGSINIPTGETYKINGSAHTHSYATLLTNSSISPTTSNVTAAVGTRYFADISGLTANRNFVLPTCSAGNEIELKITTGDDTYELVIIGDTGVSIEGGATATEWARTFMVKDTFRFVADGSNSWRVAYDGRRESYVVLQDQKSSGTNGGTATGGAGYATRTLNTEVQDDDGICSLSSDQFTLRAGTYRIRAVCPAIGVNSHRAKLYNATDTADVILSDSAYAAAAEVASPAIIQGKFTITATKTFDIRHQVQTTKSTYGFGAAYGTFGLNEYYTVVELWRV